MRQKWLVAYDFSEQSERALRLAAEELSFIGGELLLVHIHRPLSTAFGAEFASISPAFRDVDTTIEDTATRRLNEVAQRYTEGFDDITLRSIVAPGNPADQIAQLADEEGVARIVIGSHGRRGFKRIFLGSVAERVLREAACTVVVVKGGGAEEMTTD